MEELKVGKTIYLIPLGINNKKFKGNILDYIKESKISKIGKKYFYLEGYSVKFDKISLKHEDLQGYLNKQDIYDNIEIENLENKIKAKFNAYGGIELSLEQLRAIDKIIFGE